VVESDLGCKREDSLLKGAMVDVEEVSTERGSCLRSIGRDQIDNGVEGSDVKYDAPIRGYYRSY
jgi:hypothetical protein